MKRNEDEVTTSESPLEASQVNDRDEDASGPTTGRTVRVVAGYDGSPSAANAIEVAARLLPAVRATIVHLWEPPFASPGLQQRLARQATGLQELIDLLEAEGHAEADRLVRRGVLVAQSTGWQADPLVQRSFGGDGHQFARLAEQYAAALTVVGSRGLGGVQAVLGSMSDLVVHVSPVPVLVVPDPLTTAEIADTAAGPVLVGTDGSPAAQRAAEVAARLFPDRELLQATIVAHDDVAAESREDVVQLRVGGRLTSESAVARALIGYADTRGAAVVVVGSRGHSAGRELLLGSVAKAVLHNTHRPVLVVPPATR
jgi:nucleotide-binding universal stress UspA family protein